MRFTVASQKQNDILGNKVLHPFVGVQLLRSTKPRLSLSLGSFAVAHWYGAVQLLICCTLSADALLEWGGFLMPRRASGSIDAQRKVWLMSWRVLQTDSGTRHFVGYSVEDRIGRVSTPISSYDPNTRIGKASNGGVYKLLGPPGVDAEAMYVWRQFARVWRFTEAMDVSPEYFVPTTAGTW
jgi:hypothetical protein